MEGSCWHLGRGRSWLPERGEVCHALQHPSVILAFAESCRTTDKISQSPRTFQMPPGGQCHCGVSPRGHQSCLIWCRPAPASPHFGAWLLIFQEVTVLFQESSSAGPAWGWGCSPGHLRLPRQAPASLPLPRSTFSAPPQQPRGERHVASFSFTWGLLQTRKVL